MAHQPTVALPPALHQRPWPQIPNPRTPEGRAAERGRQERRRHDLLRPPDARGAMLRRWRLALLVPDERRRDAAPDVRASGLRWRPTRQRLSGLDDG